MSEKQVNIIAVGDVCPGDIYFSLGHGIRSNFEKFGPDFIFAKVNKILSRGDFTFCNLEGTLSDLELDQNSFESLAFRGHPDMSECLRNAGFNIVNIANNHILQHGKEVFLDTLANTKKAGLELLGIKDNNKFSSQPIIKDCHGTKIGFLGYSLVPEQHYPSDPTPYAMSTIQEIKNDIRLLKSSVDFMIVSCHYGIEHINRPSPFGIDFTHSLIDAGVDVFLGHHSHVFQPVEKYKNGVILYSLGNFVFDILWDKRYTTTAIAEITLHSSHSIEVTIHPVKINKKGQPELVLQNNITKYNLLNEFSSNNNIFNRESHNYLYYSQVYKSVLYLTCKKLLFFIQYLPYGHTRLKLIFISKKVFSRLSAFLRIIKNVL